MKYSLYDVLRKLSELVYKNINNRKPAKRISIQEVQTRRGVFTHISTKKTNKGKFRKRAFEVIYV